LLPTDLICQIGNPSDVEAVLIIDQAYIDLIRIDPVKGGPPVRLLLEAHTRRAYDSQIEEIASTELKVASPGMSAAKGGRLETKMNPAGQMQPLNTSYQARAPWGDAAGALEAGMQGQARIYPGWQPLARRVYRMVIKTFNFDF
jgi:putative peptide zinc metalloprotease protein